MSKEFLKKNYIPSYIAEQYKKNIFSGSIECSVLITDISGFTPMTELLFEKGEKGAEEMSRQLVDIFETPISVINSYGGSVSSFAGDAFTAFFPQDDGSRAYSCANKIIKFFIANKEKHTPFGILNFSCRCGIGRGLINWNIINILKDMFTYFFSGPGIDHALEQLDKAEINEIASMSPEYKVVEPGCFEQIDLDPTILKKFIPSRVLETEVVGELRHIASIFIKISKQERNSVEQVVKMIVQEVEKLGGTFNKVDYGDKGLILLVFFGAPEAKERPEELAVRFAYRVFKKNNSISIGIDSGLCYAGRVGGILRAEWTCLGDVVNTSARLMSLVRESSAKKEEINNRNIILSSRVKNRADKIGDFYEIGEIRLKGKKDPEKLYSLSGLKLTRAVEFKYPMVGREIEYNQLRNFVKPIFKGENAGVCYIYGEAGLGKSRLVWELLNELERESQDTSILYLPCEEATKAPWNPIVDWMRDFFSPEGKDPSKETIISKLREFDNIKLEKRINFISSILGIYWEEEQYQNHDDRRRKEGQIFALKELIKEISSKNPTIIFVDDLQCIDELTLEWLAFLTRNVPDYQFTVICTSRFDEKGGKPRINLDSRVNVLEIELNPFNKQEDIDNMVFQITGEIPSLEMRKFLIKKAQGNPFFLEQTIMYLNEQNMLQGKPLSIKGKFERLPETLSDLLTARLDLMDVELREIVKRASVIGERFLIELLRRIIDDEELKDDLDFFLEKGEEDQVLVRELNYENTYLFRHALLREAAYQLYLPSERKVLHCKILDEAEELLKKEIENYITLFIEQAERGEQWSKWEQYTNQYLHYLDKMFANQEVLRISNKLLAFYRQHKNNSKIAETLVIKGKILKRIGRLNQAEQTFLEAEKISQQIDDLNIKAVALNDLGSVSLINGDFQLAEKRYKKALSFAKQLNEENLQSKIHGNLGILFVRLGEIEQALENYHKALDLTIRLSMVNDQVKVLYNIGALKAQNSQYGQAREYFEKGLALAEKNNLAEEKAGAVLNLGILEANSEHLEKAADYFNQAYKIFKEYQIKQGESLSLSNLIESQIQLHNFDKALNLINEYIDLAKEVGDNQAECSALLKKGKIFTKKSEFKKATKFFLESQFLAEQNDDMENEIIIFIYLAYNNYLQQKSDMVKHYLRILSEKIKKIENPNLVFQRIRWIAEEIKKEQNDEFIKLTIKNLSVDIDQQTPLKDLIEKLENQIFSS